MDNNQPQGNENSNMPPQNTMGSQPPAAIYSQPPTNSSRPSGKNPLVIILLSILGLAVVAAAVWYFVFYVSKDDYKTAQSRAEETRSSYDQAKNKMDAYQDALSVANGKSTSGVEEAKKAFESSYADYKSKATSMKDLKAMRDAEVKKSYDSFAERHQKFTKANDDLVPLMQDLAKSRETCAESRFNESMSSATASNLVTTFDNSFRGCRELVVKMSNSSITPISNYGKKMVRVIDSLHNYMERIQSALISRDKAQYDKAVSDYSTDSDIKNMSSYGTTLQKEIEEYMPTITVKDQLKDLIDLATKKAS